MKQQLVNFINTNTIGAKAVLAAPDATVFNFRIMTPSHDHRAASFETPLISALIRTNNYDLATQLINSGGVNVNALDSNNATPLSYAIDKEHKALVLLLAQNGANTQTFPYCDSSWMDGDPKSICQAPGVNIGAMITGQQGWESLKAQNPDAVVFLQGLLNLSEDSDSF